ncbi:hypothetical protein [Kribbella amoyensis]|uniref:hypothetical protein n=1 Tax=Kribbella amoyensis TaxID=996641 RepID=UPI001EE1AA8A|nr:hypothetical protein [Kribbella amoyensis]
MRNYWALLPAIAVCVVLILLYAVPTLINPQWTTNILGLFRQQPEEGEPGLSPKRVQSRRMLAGLMVLAAFALVGFNISLNREANGCYQAARAWGAIDGADREKDPCINKIYGSFIGDGSGSVTGSEPQPVAAYQVVEGKKPKYLRWIQNRPSYNDIDLVIGVGGNCALDLRVVESEDKVTAVIDNSDPCPPDDDISIASIELKEPLGDRKVVTVDDKELKKLDVDLDSWPTVLGKLVTGG